LRLHLQRCCILAAIAALAGCYDVCDQACQTHADYLAHCGTWDAYDPWCGDERCRSPAELVAYCREAWAYTQEERWEERAYLDLVRNACERTVLVADVYGECDGSDSPMVWFDSR